MNKQKIDSKTLLIILLLIVSLMIVVFVFISIKNTYDTRIEIKNEQLLLNQYKSELVLLNSIKTREDDINEMMLLCLYKIPDQPYEDKIIMLINSISGDAELLGITFANRVENDIATEMPIKINIKSDYFTMLKILGSIVNAQRFFTVNNIDITVADSSYLNYTINLNAYYTPRT